MVCGVTASLGLPQWAHSVSKRQAHQEKKCHLPLLQEVLHSPWLLDLVSNSNGHPQELGHPENILVPADESPSPGS